MNKFSIVLTLLLCGSCALALDPNLEKTKSATGIDLPTAKWNLPKELNEDGTIDETKMPKKIQNMAKWLFWEIKFLMKQANMWVHKPKILKKDLREIIFLVQAVMLMVEVCKINRVL
ncbi:hypothetical protein QR378_02285 [Campylobacter jejuni]|uniref:hypothetical protein n=1 Tax=Campylobacter jejuni TaxID=197 RepID=UPI0020445E8E|nr:hypothetical protein [Campylobacter jejuni]KAJ9737645.1 hypothetical protein QR355_06930 [Campylobacter jejuni]KAJ9772987.1 hypothetical protein QR411_06430 [Campylobacter jejuni]KAJ9776278.1 hypothetical protein QR378_02285 [Campylobacter jejuni]KAJ9840377.1 hypothetical protein QR390_07185 [Campylobacter jejuni]MDK2133621.1 hypothetical protein [Campylobacter jejuni]